jgi:hypothetical protein
LLFIHKLSKWISIPLLILLFLAAIPAVLCALFATLMACLFANDSWDHQRLTNEMATGDFRQLSTSVTDTNQPQPRLTASSPNREWVVSAQWNKLGFYDWSLTNEVTGQAFNRGARHEDVGCGGPSRLSFLWNQDSHYVAVNSLEDGFWRVRVINLSGRIPEYFGPPDSSPFDAPSLISGNGENIQEVQAKALEWKDNGILKIVIFVRSYTSAGPYDIAAAAHASFHIDGSNWKLLTQTPDFREEFIADL